MPPSIGQSPVLFESGYDEGWAKCMSMCKAAFTSPPKRQPEPCMCGETYRLGVVHRKDTPCFDYIEHVWIGLTDDEIKAIVGPWGSTEIKGYTRTLFDQIEAKLKEKNT
jgi:hypothetical protein